MIHYSNFLSCVQGWGMLRFPGFRQRFDFIQNSLLDNIGNSSSIVPVNHVSVPLHLYRVEVEEVGDALGVVRELPAIGPVNERIEVLVGLQKIGRRLQGVVEHRQGAARIGVKILLPHVEDCLRGGGDFIMRASGTLAPTIIDGRVTRPA